jgi:hypothetical protein
MSALLVCAPSILNEIRKVNAPLAEAINANAKHEKVQNPAHTTPNLGLFLLAVISTIGSVHSYSNGASQMALGTNRVVTKENNVSVSKIISEKAEPVLVATGKTNNSEGVPSWYSAVANAIQVPGMKQGPEPGFLRYLEAFTDVPLSVLTKIRDADAEFRSAFKAANAAKLKAVQLSK